MAGRELPPSSPFASDDGTCDAALAAVLDDHARGHNRVAEVVEALAGTRVLVPVLAVLDAAGVVEHDGRQHTVDKEASTGIVALRAPDGRTALPVFTSVASMAAWRADARPVPSEVARAALSAVSEGWELLVLDPGGPVTVLIPRPAVWALARQEQWRPAVGATPEGLEVDGEVRDAVRRALSQIGEVRAADAEPGRRAEVAVVLGVVPGLDRTRLDAVLAQVNDALAADETIAARVDSVELRLRAAG
ncbi:SseB family protein [Cellulomonas timonensis]|uniref:SseB family protein n=1 Tax=Cellulomonas timonensis TaxID=1689271 RepID=UPI000829BA11|nr:SseB family protein [Cellulomonas timonensis]